MYFQLLYLNFFEFRRFILSIKTFATLYVGSFVVLFFFFFSSKINGFSATKGRNRYNFETVKRKNLKFFVQKFDGDMLKILTKPNFC